MLMAFHGIPAAGGVPVRRLRLGCMHNSEKLDTRWVLSFEESEQS